jgi:hypothetical protein
MKAVWRVMVPVYYNDGRRIPDRVHLEWQDELVKISRGWTMHATALGAWLEDGASLPQIEDMRPVDILCTEEQLDAIIDLSGRLYKQKEVFAYKVTEDFRSVPTVARVNDGRTR